MKETNISDEEITFERVDDDLHLMTLRGTHPDWLDDWTANYVAGLRLDDSYLAPFLQDSSDGWLLENSGLDNLGNADKRRIYELMEICNQVEQERKKKCCKLLSGHNEGKLDYANELILVDEIKNSRHIKQSMNKTAPSR